MFFKKKIFFIYFILAAFFYLLSFSLLISSELEVSNENFCETVDPINFIEQKSPDEIIIETNNARRWATNLFNLFLEFNSEKYKTNNNDWFSFQIDEKFKKKFKSKIKFVYKDPDYECLSKGRISVRGNLWWHLDWKDGVPFSSLRVDLKNGHVNNLVNFNLLLPKSRNSLNGNINLELFITTLFNKVGLLAPKSRIVKVKVNEKKNKYLFQEILSKEFLESRNLLEGPIFEGDQQYTAEQFSKNKWRGDLGLARMINASYAAKNKVNADLSLIALSKLNNIFIDGALKDNDDYARHRCEHHFLTVSTSKYFKDEEATKIHQIYEALIFATQADHSLTCDDRKFYYDPIKNYFLPIYNDGKSTLNIESDSIYYKIKNSDVSENSVKGARDALKLISDIDNKDFFVELVQNGFFLNFEEFKKIKERVKKNLEALSKTKAKDQFVSTANYFENKDQDYFGQEVKLIFKDLTKNNLEICDLKLINCEKINIKNDDILLIKSLLGQNISSLNNLEYPFLKKEKVYLFLSTSKNYSSLDSLYLNEEKFSDKAITKQFNISYTEHVAVDIDYKKKQIIFNLLNPSGRVKIYGNLVDSWSFKIDGENFFKNNRLNNNEYLKSKLTGCVTFIDIKVKNLIIESNYSLCEDSFNFIRSYGNVLKADIKNSFSDGLDLDFSNMIIENLYINDSKNDCIDFSYGTYEILNSKIENCGDKAISIGEKSNVKILSSNIKNSNFGVASKDSSSVLIKNTNIKNTKFCLAAYRKKQEFSGSIVDTDEIKCDNYSKVFEVDAHSRISKRNVIF
jgi:hypothetical protein